MYKGHFIFDFRFHFKSWKHWCKRNQDVRLLVKNKNSDENKKKYTIKDDCIEDVEIDRIRRYTGIGKFSRWFNFSLSHRFAMPTYNIQQQTTFV